MTPGQATKHSKHASSCCKLCLLHCWPVLLLCPTSIMAYRVPVPVHINNLGTPRVQQIGQLSAKPAVAVLPETAGLQHSTDSNGHMCKLLSLPSFGKVVYRSSNFGPTSLAVSKQRSLSGPAARVGTGIDSQQMLLQGHDSSLSRPPSLEFDSQFESGNLQKAVQASDHLCHL